MARHGVSQYDRASREVASKLKMEYTDCRWPKLDRETGRGVDPEDQWSSIHSFS